MLNSLKKLEQHDYIENVLTINPKIENLPVKEITHFFNGRLTPNRAIKNKKVYEIIEIDPIWVINGLSVTTENNNVARISIFGFHPNKNPETGLFCLPTTKFNVQYSTKFFNMLLRNIKTFYLDDCYVVPPKGHVIYKEIESFHANLKGEINDR